MKQSNGIVTQILEDMQDRGLDERYTAYAFAWRAFAKFMSRLAREVVFDGNDILIDPGFIRRLLLEFEAEIEFEKQIAKEGDN